MNFSVHFHEVPNPGIDTDICRTWINALGTNKDINIYNIKYILCSDDYLLAINEKHLNHHDYTDVITFNLSKDVIDAEVYISVDRADENASKRGIELQDEIHRLMAHGLLHLSGMNDATEKEKEEMRIAEDESLELLKKMFHVKP